MGTFPRLTTFAAAAMISLGLCGGAIAQAPADSSATPPASPKGHVAIRHGGQAGNRTALIEQRIAGLHASLQITSAQQPQWDAFTQVMRDNARDMDARFQARVKAVPSMTAPENMQSYAQLAEEHAQEVQKLVPAFQTLYDAMSDAQKRTADQVFRNQAGRPRHH